MYASYAPLIKILSAHLKDKISSNVGVSSIFELDHHSILSHFRNLLPICSALFCCVTITNGNCEDTPANCVWDSQQKTYTCDIIGVPNDIVIRRLRLSHLKISGSIYNVTANPDTKDIGISWNKTYITLFVCMHVKMLQRFMLMHIIHFP